MIYQIVRLSPPHSLSSKYAYMIEFEKRTFTNLQSGRSGMLAFDQARVWFNRTFNECQRIDPQTKSYMLTNPRWGWTMAYDEYRIYVASEMELNWFVLAHPATGALAGD